MGHTRLGHLPKTHKWNELVAQVLGTGLGSLVAPAGLHADAIAAQTLEASKEGLNKAATDSGVLYSFYLLTQVAQASRKHDWERSLATHGIQLTEQSDVFELTSQVQGAIDRYISRSSSGRTDLSEMAQQSVGEALTSLVGWRSTKWLFDEGRNTTRDAVRAFSTPGGFGKLGQFFFGRFFARFLNFYLSRITAAGLGNPRLRNLADIADFDHALRTHCDQSARIVRDFCGDWYSKTAFQEGIDLSNTSRFLAVAVKKLRSEIQQQRDEL